MSIWEGEDQAQALIKSARAILLLGLVFIMKGLLLKSYEHFELIDNILLILEIVALIMIVANFLTIGSVSLSKEDGRDEYLNVVFLRSYRIALQSALMSLMLVASFSEYFQAELGLKNTSYLCFGIILTVISMSLLWQMREELEEEDNNDK